MKVAVINSGVGNLGAIPNMIARLGALSKVTLDPAEIGEADRIILPGVGSFDAAMRNLKAAAILPELHESVLKRGTPFLGVCLGMQLLFEQSEEGDSPGLGWIPGKVVRFQFSGLESPPRIPHMGWNLVRPTGDAQIFRDLGERPRFYFAHSFHVEPDDLDDIIATTHYGRPFASAVQRANVTGIQFHPEKSHRFGLAVLRNFLVG